MLTEVKKNIKLIFLCFKYNLLRAMDNRISFVSQILGMILNNGLMIIQWIVLFSIKDNIGGYGFKEILLLWAFASSTYGVMHSLFYNSNFLSGIIYTGKLDAFLVQPKNTLIYTISSGSSVSALGDFLYGYILLIVIKASPLTWLLFTLFVFTGGIILTSFMVIWHSLSFKFNNVEEFASVMGSSVINFATYPMGIFSDNVRWLFMTILPVAWTVYIPIKVITKFSLPWLLAIIGVCILITAIAFMVFNRGLKRYNSGNLMSARI